MRRHSPTLPHASLLIALAFVATAVIPGAPTATAQEPAGFQRCGDPNLVLIFKNPDLQPQSDGWIHASGFFFIQFQAIGERALDIEKFAFSFGKPLDPPANACDLPADTPFAGAHLTGAYLWKYRADDVPEDGFFVPINTTNVPDGEYGAAISAFDSSGTEIVRYYAKAKVENGCPLGWRGSSCNMETIVANDKVKPWPIVLPGDGDQTHPAGGLTLEFAEPLIEDPIVYITPHQGIPQRVPIQLLDPGQCRQYDDDAVPDNQFEASAIQLRCWGPTYHWSGAVRMEDIIRVRARDLNNNEVEKILHIGDPTIGGRIVLAYPDAQVLINGTQREADKFGRAVYPFEVKNVGNGTLHGNLLLDQLPDGIQAKFDRDHPVTGPGATHFANLTVTALESLSPGNYEITGMVRYQRAAEEVQKPWSIQFTLKERSNATEDQEVVVKGSRPDEELKVDPYAPPTVESNETEPVDEEAGGFLGLPGPGALAALAAVGVAAAAFGPARFGRRRG